MLLENGEHSLMGDKLMVETWNPHPEQTAFPIFPGMNTHVFCTLPPGPLHPEQQYKQSEPPGANGTVVGRLPCMHPTRF